MEKKNQPSIPKPPHVQPNQAEGDRETIDEALRHMTDDMVSEGGTPGQERDDVQETDRKAA